MRKRKLTSRLQESSLSSEEISKLKGTGKGGMLTKGDVLVALGQLKNPWGSAEKLNLDVMGPSGKRKSEVSLYQQSLEIELTERQRQQRARAPVRCLHQRRRSRWMDLP
jgi:hypothetical protein